MREKRILKRAREGGGAAAAETEQKKKRQMQGSGPIGQEFVCLKTEKWRVHKNKHTLACTLMHTHTH